MKNIKTKDIVVLILATVMIVVSAYVIWYLLAPKKESTTKDKTKETQMITGQIDDNTYNKINGLSDYGEPALDNIGKSNLFE